MPDGDGPERHATPDRAPRSTGAARPVTSCRPSTRPALVAARHADRLVAAAEAAGATRWLRYFEAMPDRLRDDEPRSLRQVALRARAAYGPKDSGPGRAAARA